MSVADPDSLVCGAYVPPADPEDSGFCDCCGMYDWRHRPRYRVMKPGHPGDWLVLTGFPGKWRLAHAAGFPTWIEAFGYAYQEASRD